MTSVIRTTFAVLVSTLLLPLGSNAGAPDPWFELTHELDAIIARSKSQHEAFTKVRSHLNSNAPAFMRTLTAEGRTSAGLVPLWGKSVNFDEGAKATIVSEPTIDVVLSTAGAPPRGHGVKSKWAPRIVHAGFEHTYGYLLSNLNTPFGHKRLRWTQTEINDGFGLPQNTIAPLPDDGGLFSNVTVFAGSIAFRELNPEDQASLDALLHARGAARAVRRYPYQRLKGKRLTETLSLPGGQTLEIRTDFVRFVRTDFASTNTELLIYSVRDSREKFAKLITLFPVTKGFSDAATSPAELGEHRLIKTRYNLFIEGVTDSRRAFLGSRVVTRF
jgi:hypothetical protein